MALLFFAAIPEIIYLVRSEKWPHSTYLWHFALLFQYRKYATSPHITSLPRGLGVNPVRDLSMLFTVKVRLAP